MSLFGSGKAINEGLFHVLVLAFAVYLFIHGHGGPGEVMMYSVLFLNVMTPLSEVHRFIDEGHESSLKIGDLIGLLTVPIDRSFRTPASEEGPRLALGEPLFASEGMKVEFPVAGRPARRAPQWPVGHHPARRDHRRGRPVGLRQDDLAPRSDAAGASLRRRGHPGRGPARSRLPQGHRRAGRLRRPESLPLRRHRRGRTSPTAARGPPPRRSAAPPRWPASTTRSC